LLYRTFRRDFEVVQATSARHDKILDQADGIRRPSDQQIPEMLGTEFFELIKSISAFPIPFRIVLTGYTDNRKDLHPFCINDNGSVQYIR
jgi:CheY-like chemotaxis protein